MKECDQGVVITLMRSCMVLDAGYHWAEMRHRTLDQSMPCLSEEQRGANVVIDLRIQEGV